MDLCQPLERADAILVSSSAKAKWRDADILLSEIRSGTVGSMCLASSKTLLSISFINSHEICERDQCVVSLITFVFCLLLFLLLLLSTLG